MSLLFRQCPSCGRTCPEALGFVVNVKLASRFAYDSSAGTAADEWSCGRARCVARVAKVIARRHEDEIVDRTRDLASAGDVIVAADGRVSRRSENQ